MRWLPSPTPAPRADPWTAAGAGQAASAWQRPGFGGDNDVGTIMWDPDDRGGFDGLERDGSNRNQGTESTLALLSTLQHARSAVTVLR